MVSSQDLTKSFVPTPVFENKCPGAVACWDMWDFLSPWSWPHFPVLCPGSVRTDLFSHTLIESMILQSRVKPCVMAMCHHTNSGKSATGPNTDCCNQLSTHPYRKYMSPYRYSCIEVGCLLGSAVMSSHVLDNKSLQFQIDHGVLFIIIWVHSSVVRAADCRSAGPWFKSGCALLIHPGWILR